MPRPGSPGDRPRAAFTLVELLVVIAIIAILAGLLMPGLKSARDKGRAAVCMSNLKQLMLASVMYANDNGGVYPVDYDAGNGFDIRQRMGVALGYMKSLSTTEWNNWVARQQWGPYHCPAQLWKWTNGYTYPSYGINSGDVGGGKPGFSGRPQDSIKHPGRMFAFSDLQDTTNYRFTSGVWFGYPGTETMQRHNEGVITAFADGHVEFIDPARGAPLRYDTVFWLGE